MGIVFEKVTYKHDITKKHKSIDNISIEITDNLGRFTTVDKYKIKVINK